MANGKMRLVGRIGQLMSQVLLQSDRGVARGRGCLSWRGFGTACLWERWRDMGVWAAGSGQQETDGSTHQRLFPLSLPDNVAHLLKLPRMGIGEGILKILREISKRRGNGPGVKVQLVNFPYSLDTWGRIQWLVLRERLDSCKKRKILCVKLQCLDHSCGNKDGQTSIENYLVCVYIQN